MQRRQFLRFGALPILLVPGLALAQAPLRPIQADAADLSRVESYLNNIHTLRAHFMQVAPDGSLSEGTAWLERPGRMRFEYNPPAPFLLVASGGNFVFEDKSINQISEIPLGLTPLGILLGEHVSLSGDVTVTGLERQPGQLQVTLVRTRSPGDGSLTLVFADQPLALRQWTVLDAQQRQTRVTLYNVELGMPINPDVFHFKDPRSFQNPTGGNG